MLSFSPVEGLKQIVNGVLAIWDPAGNSPRCEVLDSTLAMELKWQSKPGQEQQATGQDVMPSVGIETHLSLAIFPLVTGFKNIHIHSVSWLMQMETVSSMKGQTFATTLTQNTVGKFSCNQSNSHGRFSTQK